MGKEQTDEFMGRHTDPLADRTYVKSAVQLHRNDPLGPCGGGGFL